MNKSETKKAYSVVLNLSNNSERETILNSIIASGEFEIDDAEGVVTLHFKKPLPRKQHAELPRTSVLRTRKLLKLGLDKHKKHAGILERVARSQNITLATSDTLDAICSGIIV